MRIPGLHKNQRVEVEIPGMGSMVLPDTYEPEKFERPDENDRLETERLKNIDESQIDRTELTKDDLHRIKFAKMFKEVDNLKAINKDIESHRLVI